VCERERDLSEWKEPIEMHRYREENSL